MMTFRHATVGTSSLNRISSSSRLIPPRQDGAGERGLIARTVRPEKEG